MIPKSRRRSWQWWIFQSARLFVQGFEFFIESFKLILEILVADFHVTSNDHILMFPS